MKVNPLNAEVNPICHLLALLGAHPVLHISRIRVNCECLMPFSVSLLSVHYLHVLKQCNCFLYITVNKHFLLSSFYKKMYFPVVSIVVSFLYHCRKYVLNPLNPKLNPICYLLALLGAHHFLHVSRIRVKLLTFKLLMSYIYIYIYIYIYGAPILDVSISHTTTQHSR